MAQQQNQDQQQLQQHQSLMSELPPRGVIGCRLASYVRTCMHCSSRGGSSSSPSMQPRRGPVCRG